MKQKLMLGLAVAGLAMSANVYAASSANATTPALTTQMDKVSYAVGYDIGKGFTTQNIGIEHDQFVAGFTAGLNSQTPAITEQEMQATLSGFQKEMMQQAMQKQQAQAATNLTASKAYLTKIAAEPGVKQLAPGLYYKVVTAGKGPMPGPTDSVTVNYEGSLANGTVFDSSYKRGQPATFQVNQVIPGWSQAVQKMPVGSTWMVYIAPDLAYGVAAPPQIGPNQALTFKIQLISINKTSAQ